MSASRAPDQSGGGWGWNLLASLQETVTSSVNSAINALTEEEEESSQQFPQLYRRDPNIPAPASITTATTTATATSNAATTHSKPSPSSVTRSTSAQPKTSALPPLSNNTRSAVVSRPSSTISKPTEGKTSSSVDANVRRVVVKKEKLAVAVVPSADSSDELPSPPLDFGSENAPPRDTPAPVSVSISTKTNTPAANIKTKPVAAGKPLSKPVIRPLSDSSDKSAPPSKPTTISPVPTGTTVKSQPVIAKPPNSILAKPSVPPSKTTALPSFTQQAQASRPPPAAALSQPATTSLSSSTTSAASTSSDSSVASKGQAPSSAAGGHSESEEEDITWGEFWGTILHSAKQVVTTDLGIDLTTVSDGASKVAVTSLDALDTLSKKVVDVITDDSDDAGQSATPQQSPPPVASPPSQSEDDQNVTTFEHVFEKRAGTSSLLELESLSNQCFLRSQRVLPKLDETTRTTLNAVFKAIDEILHVDVESEEVKAVSVNTAGSDEDDNGSKAEPMSGSVHDSEEMIDPEEAKPDFELDLQEFEWTDDDDFLNVSSSSKKGVDAAKDKKEKEKKEKERKEKEKRDKERKETEECRKQKELKQKQKQEAAALRLKQQEQKMAEIAAESLADPAKASCVQQVKQAVESLSTLLEPFQATLANCERSASVPGSGGASRAASGSHVSMELEKQASAMLLKIHRTHMRRLAEISADAVTHMLTLAQNFVDFLSAAGHDNSTEEAEEFDYIAMAKQEAAELRSFYRFFADQLGYLSEKHLGAMDRVIADSRATLTSLSNKSTSKAGTMLPLTRPTNVSGQKPVGAAASAGTAVSASIHARQIEKLATSGHTLKTEMYLDVSNANGKLQDALEYLVPVYQAVAVNSVQKPPTTSS